ncbi:hypothetical protein OIU85_028194 [Salix viminalis]|uniref:Uncharacterized protein n=1 Tax=Salix viminalis TaxID=40686 RepID=A0A9Q0QJW8_SALVM|nr:hypothetical protein OIU85_028194 [Salix viminalis]
MCFDDDDSASSSSGCQSSSSVDSSSAEDSAEDVSSLSDSDSSSNFRSPELNNGTAPVCPEPSNGSPQPAVKGPDSNVHNNGL